MAPNVIVNRDPVSMAMDTTSGSAVFTLDCGHQVTIPPFGQPWQPGSQISCATCANLVTSGQPIPNP